ncbi:hypothetical protein ACFP1L_12035 [Lactiplantibacillus nangangensis]|uniref:50S ribosomal protein L32 n=1 Tax=Lactiplantibacillus nangangensis TaxID=2559917 RepID=A0ABW1SLV8_9LACO|nr:hypothetical protein [Lactiplantibacillus nangangensis]
MTKQRKHAKRSEIKKKRRRMRLHAAEHSKNILAAKRIKHTYAPYKVGDTNE